MEKSPLSDDPDNPEPLVSILIPAYNAERWISDAICSALRQTYHRIEVIVCDDGSTDATAAIADSFRRDERVTCLRKENGGVSSALNAAFEASNGSIVCLLDADDLFLPHKVARIVETLGADHAAGVVMHRVLPVSANRRPLPPALPTRVASGPSRCSLLEAINAPRPPASGLTFRREPLLSMFPLPETLRAGVDAYLAVGVTLTSGSSGIEDALALYRLHDSNLTGAVSPRLESVETHIEQYIDLRDAFELWTVSHGFGQLPDATTSPHFVQLLALECVLAGSSREKRSDLRANINCGSTIRRMLWRLELWLPPRLALLLAKRLHPPFSPWRRVPYATMQFLSHGRMLMTAIGASRRSVFDRPDC